jgi:hypothetical protein
VHPRTGVDAVEMRNISCRYWESNRDSAVVSLNINQVIILTDMRCIFWRREIDVCAFFYQLYYNEYHENKTVKW